MPDDMIKVVFELPTKGPGAWTGFETERLWARRTGPTLARLDNHPFFVRGYAYDDEVRFRENRLGELIVTGLVQASGRCAIRIALIGRTDEFHDLEVQAGIRRDFEPLGVTCEMAGPNLFNLVSLDVPPEVDIAEVRRRLLAGEAAGRWYFEEGCITAAWEALLGEDTAPETPSGPSESEL